MVYLVCVSSVNISVLVTIMLLSGAVTAWRMMPPMVAYCGMVGRHVVTRLFASSSSTDDRHHKLSRVFIDNKDLQEGNTIELDESLSHYLTNVMRLRDGDRFRSFNSVSGEYLCELRDSRGSGKRSRKASKTGVVEAVVSSQLRRVQPSDHYFPCVLYFSPLKKRERMKILIEKAVEIGVQKLVPVVFANTQVQEEVLSSKEEFMSTWNKKIIESCEQSERLTIPTLYPSITFTDLLRDDPNRGPLLICTERLGVDSTQHTVSLLSALDDTALSRPQQSIGSEHFGVVVGPEGGFTVEELNLIKASLHHLPRNNIIKSVSLGSTVLRAETAAIYALCVASARFCK
jgi:16S rRNA (uracil1498-N3)-methyltransferase